jgi:hypothetical protein
MNTQIDIEDVKIEPLTSDDIREIAGKSSMIMLAYRSGMMPEGPAVYTANIVVRLVNEISVRNTALDTLVPDATEREALLEKARVDDFKRMSDSVRDKMGEDKFNKVLSGEYKEVIKDEFRKAMDPASVTPAADLNSNVNYN